MEAGARAKLDDSILRPRLRRDFEPAHIKRPVARPQPRPTLLQDVTLRQHTRSDTGTAPRANTSQPVAPKPPQPIESSIQSFASQFSDSSPGPAAGTMAAPQHQPRIKRLLNSKYLKKHLAIRHKNKLQLALVMLAIGIVLAGGYISLIGLKANHIAQVQATNLTAEANKTATSTKSNPTTPALATVKPSAHTLADYVVAPDLPRYIMIPKLGVDTIVESVGVNSQGALETPDNVYNTAWYNESAEPGQPGAMLIDGHVSSWTAHGVFYGIKTLVAGDIIKIERGDGTIFSYTVVKNQVYPSGNVDMAAAMTPVVAGQPGLNLITCAGDVIPGTSQFNERIVVYATLQT